MFSKGYFSIFRGEVCSMLSKMINFGLVGHFWIEQLNISTRGGMTIQISTEARFRIYSLGKPNDSQSTSTIGKLRFFCWNTCLVSSSPRLCTQKPPSFALGVGIYRSFRLYHYLLAASVSWRLLKNIWLKLHSIFPENKNSTRTDA